jgi:AcrR family transcriptional regulator
MRKPRPQRPNYHHGDLRRALLDAGVTILAESGHWEFSLRELARRAGVSHNAPYAHFADKDALLAEIAVAGFETLRSRMFDMATATEDSGDALIAIGRVYAAFGAENPALYRLMFGPTLTRGDADNIGRVAEGAASARSILHDTISRGLRDGSFAVSDEPEEIAVAAMSAWALVHGLTMLFIDGLASAETDLGLDRLVQLVGFRFSIGIARKNEPAQTLS